MPCVRRHHPSGQAAGARTPAAPAASAPARRSETESAATGLAGWFCPRWSWSRAAGGSVMPVACSCILLTAHRWHKKTDKPGASTSSFCSEHGRSLISDHCGALGALRKIMANRLCPTAARAVSALLPARSGSASAAGPSCGAPPRLRQHLQQHRRPATSGGSGRGASAASGPRAGDLAAQPEDSHLFQSILSGILAPYWGAQQQRKDIQTASAC
jgi:hypothetical protein